MVRSWLRSLAIAPINEDGRASHPLSGFDVAASIADQEAAAGINAKSCRSTAQHTRSRLPAIATVLARVIASFNCIDGKRAGQESVHRLDFISLHEPFADVRLIGDYYQQKARCLELPTALSGIIIEAEILDPAHSEGAAVAELRNRENAVAI